LTPLAKKKPAPPPPATARMLEDIVGCKWSLCVLDLIGKGVVRPGEMQRHYHGLTAKVLNERLRKMVRFGIVERRAWPEVPPRVEYHLTPFGHRFGRLLDEIRALERACAEGTFTSSASGARK
jgi:DNA-binding HxlR family transcriptional regulator